MIGGDYSLPTIALYTILMEKTLFTIKEYDLLPIIYVVIYVNYNQYNLRISSTEENKKFLLFIVIVFSTVYFINIICLDETI